MKIAGMDYIINTISRTNVLPIITKCNTTCCFCSHKQNMSYVEAFVLPELTMDDFKELFNYLTPGKKIIIGESATRIVEGEPLLHDRFVEILEMLRKKFKKTTIQITTNGILLSQALVDKMVALGNIELNISVNCINPEKRKIILGRNANIDIRSKLELVSGRLPLSGSCVYVPETMNNEDLEELVAALKSCNASHVKFFVPGYTGEVPEGMELAELYLVLTEQAGLLGKKYDIPVIVEPSLITNLECRLEGIIQGSPAQKAGLKTGDVICTVDEINFKTRANTFGEVYKRKDPELTITRDNCNIKVKLLKQRNESPGFIVLYDIRTEEVDKIIAAAKRYNAASVLLVTSELALPVIKRLFDTVHTDFDLEIIAAANNYFGGSIKCAGLLTTQDIISAVQKHLNKSHKPELIMLPPIMFDYRGKDLLGKTILDIADKIKIPVCIPE